MGSYTRDNKEFRQHIAQRARELQRDPWCEACGDFHPERESCAQLRREFAANVAGTSEGLWQRAKHFMLVLWVIGMVLGGWSIHKLRRLYGKDGREVKRLTQ